MLKLVVVHLLRKVVSLDNLGNLVVRNRNLYDRRSIHILAAVGDHLVEFGFCQTLIPLVVAHSSFPTLILIG